MKRTVTPELLDSDAGTPEEVADSLADLRGINRKFGGIGTTQAMIEHVWRRGLPRQVRQVPPPRGQLSLLEVGAGSGDVPLAIRDRLAGRGLSLRVTLLDRSASHLTAGNHHHSVVANGLALPLADDSFDLVSCGLFAHHLSPDEVVQFVAEGLRVCRTAVLINDLVRSPIHLALVYAAYPLYRSRLTRHDGPASVRAAYTPEEIRSLIAKTAAARVEILRHYLYRMGVMIWKK
jgi:ubiquinone/menaquinone biosynthesis C-methylase UbiE